MKVYCRKCGGPTEYTLNKPKFCAACGQSLFTSGSKNENIPPKQKVSEHTALPTETTDDERVPDLAGLDIDIDVPRAQGYKFGDVLGSSPTEERWTNNNENIPKQSKEDFLKQFKKEAGSIRDNNTATDKE